MIRSYLKKKILAQYQGRADLQTGGIHRYVEDLKRGPNAEIGPKDFFEIASSRSRSLVESKRDTIPNAPA
jgi:hypothetical protein